jgi:hypothetical protein
MAASTIKNALITSRGPDHVALNWGREMPCEDAAARAAWGFFRTRARVDVTVEETGRGAARVVEISAASA